MIYSCEYCFSAKNRDLVDTKSTGIISDTIGNMILLKSIHLSHLYYANPWDCNEIHSASLNRLPKHSKLNNECQSKHLDTIHEDNTVNHTNSMVNIDEAFEIILRLILYRLLIHLLWHVILLLSK